jgi:transposase
MFPRIVKSKKKSGTYEYLVISESIHVKGRGSTTRNIANLGNKSKFQPEDVAAFIDGLIRLFQVEKYGLAEEVEIIESLEHGSIIFWRQLWNQMKLSATIQKLISRKEGRIKIDVAKYVEMMVINRCAEPLSKLGATRWIGRTCYTAMKDYRDLSLEVEYWYRSMDYLLRIKDELERALYDRLRTLFSVTVRLTFYDITSTFFYSGRCPIGKKGFSRDKRPDKEQIVIGVVTSYEGYPIKHYVFEGNTKDETTVIGVVKELKKEYKIEETTFVGDRGMITKLNLATIEKEGFDYIMGVKVRQSEVHAMLFEDEQVEEREYVEHNGLKIQEKQIRVKDFLLWKSQVILENKNATSDGQDLSSLQALIDSLENDTVVEISAVKKALWGITQDRKVYGRISTLLKKYQGRYDETLRTIICLNEERKALAKQKREAKMASLSESLSALFAQSKTETDVATVEKGIAVLFEGSKRRYAKYFQILREEETQKAIGYAKNEKTMEQEEKLDGIFLLTTSRQDLPASKVVESYKNLREVEILFDDLKNFVDIHPIRHWVEVRVRAHVFLCVLALLLKRIFEINCMNGKAVMEPLEEISKSKLIKYRIKLSKKEDRHRTFPKVTQTTPEQKEIFSLVGIKNPMCLEDYVW